MEIRWQKPDKKPPENQDVLILVKRWSSSDECIKREIYVGFYFDGMWYSDEQKGPVMLIGGTKIIAWAELPDPYNIIF